MSRLETRLKIGIVGCGVVARKHAKGIRFLAKEGLCELIGVVDVSETAARNLLLQSGFTPSERQTIGTYTSVDQLLNACKPDLVAITTPSGTHAALSQQALDHNAHLLVEKPLTLDLQEADALLTKAKERQRTVAVGHIYRFFPVVQLLERAIRQGVFGEPLYGDVKVRWGHDQAYYDRAAWRGSWDQDGGVIMNQSIHALDLMVWLLGNHVVRATGRIARQCHVMEAEDLGFGIFEFANGSYCTLEGTTNTDPNQPEASFFFRGTEGSFTAGLRRGKPFLSVESERDRRGARSYIWQYIHEQFRSGARNLTQIGNPHTALYRDLIAAIHEQRAPLADGESGRQALELVLALYQSASLDRTVELPVRDFSLRMMHGFFD